MTGPGSDVTGQEGRRPRLAPRGPGPPAQEAEARGSDQGSHEGWPCPSLATTNSSSCQKPGFNFGFWQRGSERTGLEKDFDKVLAISDGIIVGRESHDGLSSSPLHLIILGHFLYHQMQVLKKIFCCVCANFQFSFLNLVWFQLIAQFDNLWQCPSGLCIVCLDFCSSTPR